MSFKDNFVYNALSKKILYKPLFIILIEYSSDLHGEQTFFCAAQESSVLRALLELVIPLVRVTLVCEDRKWNKAHKIRKCLLNFTASTTFMVTANSEKLARSSMLKSPVITSLVGWRGVPPGILNLASSFLSLGSASSVETVLFFTFLLQIKNSLKP